ncbi:MAG: nucleotidyltransferase domain-containing protein [Phycisphaerae bacterium]|nr:nucleotidyltransferase domain-containing protein [Phycisphaerae bacterium]
MLDEIVRRLVEALHPERIYLFGSHAYGAPDRDGDLDLLIVVPDDAGDRWDLATKGWMALRGVALPVDLVVFRRNEMTEWAGTRSSLPHAALEKGKLLHAA